MQVIKKNIALKQMDNFKKTSIVTIPTMSNNDWDFLQSLRKTYDVKGHAFIDPHFTFLPLNNQFSKQELVERLSTKLIKQNKIHFFIRTALFMPPLNGHKSWYVFLIPDQGFSELSKLHLQICAAGLKPISYENFPFIPHITVGSFQYKEDCLQTVDMINKNKIELTGCIEKISLIEANNNSAQIFKQIALQG